MAAKLQDALDAAVAQEQIPGMIAAISSSEGIVAIASAGLRKTGSKERLQPTDTVHLGSCTKAMTASLMASFVAEGKLTWDSRLVDYLPELKGQVHPAYHRATLWQLLTHRAGVPANAKDWSAHGNLGLSSRRLKLLKDNLQEKPSAGEGAFLYSNLGYMAAGCIAEKLSGETWETLVRTRLFLPLGMDSAGFGPPGILGKADQPWGHVRVKSQWKALQRDNPEALGPAGRVHCSLEDWAKFIALFLPGGNRAGLPVDCINLDKLVDPVGDYAAGWIVVDRPWGKGKVYTHSGSNTMWYATVWVAPKIGRAFFVVTNSCDLQSHRICDQMAWKLVQIYKSNS